MKRVQSVKFLTLLFASSIVAFSCSDDDDSGSNPAPASMTTLYASNNSNGNITSYDVTDVANITTKTLVTTSTAADGIYYDSSADAVVQASRSSNGLEGYNNVSDAVSGTTIEVNLLGTTDMESPREVAVNGDFYVVADNADLDNNPETAEGRFFVYSKNENAFVLRNTITVNFKVWGMTFNGNNLYAVVDGTNKLAVFSDFLSNMDDVTIAATKTIIVEGIVRTHGITYDSNSNTMILTDIGDATNTQDDGGFHIIDDFTSKFNATANGEILAVGEQTRVSGASTLLGNPVDVAYDSVTGIVYIAEAGNGGGRILAFNNIGNGGNLTPAVNNNLAAASSVYLTKE